MTLTSGRPTWGGSLHSVAIFYNKMKSLWEELVFLKSSMKYGDYEEESMMLFLMGLNDEYESTRSQILLYDPLPNLAMAYGMIANVQKQKKLQIIEPLEVSTMHLATSILPKAHNINKGLDYWIIDSGAITHMCNNLTKFENYNRLSSNLSIKFSDGTVKIVEYIGTLKLTDSITLVDCLFVSSFKYNMLSISKSCCTNGLVFKFSTNYCLLQESKSLRVLGVAKLGGGLYCLELQSFSRTLIN
ncbi:hypothetical protein LIER_08335 [Lithospermum erythrorhizon]|uniref:Retrovirus-related Pol polyprotein from transposon TNT 1-94-like beta-barrel domain-containing protein n=1 Tax=Lithospermum erythrorhizon TaxID=34254 RepID=A0AAV3PGA7_LITER